MPDHTSVQTMPNEASHPPRHPLWALLTAQFLGTLNDNVYKMVVSLLAVDAAVSAGHGSGVLALVSAVFMLPFLLCAGYAGHVADAFSKRSVLIAAKAFEVFATGLGCGALLTGQLAYMLGALFLLAIHAAFFGPAKYGILLELVPIKDLARANGLVEMSTFVALILGTTVGSVMLVAWRDRLIIIGVILLVVAIAGALASLCIPRVPPAGVRQAFRRHPWAQVWHGFRRLYSLPALWLTAMGLAYFWFLAALLQMAILLFGKEVMRLDDLRIGLLGTFLALGIGVGSLAAGRLSSRRVELGLIPLGSLGMGSAALLLAAASSYTGAATTLTLLGCAGGLFIIPLNAFLQHRSGQEERGLLIATTNFLSTAAVFAASGVFWALRELFQLPAHRIIFLCGLATFLGTVYVLRLLPDVFVRFCLWLLTHTWYRIRLVGQEHLPLHGPALLVCNHLSCVDGILIGACLPRFVRFLVYRPLYKAHTLHWFLRLMHVIPMTGGPEASLALDQARQELQQGHVVCIFAKGAISRTGNVLRFRRGFEKITAGLDVPVVPVHLDRLRGSMVRLRQGSGSKWERLRRLSQPVTISFGPRLPSTTTAAQARQALMELGSAVASQHPRDP